MQLAKNSFLAALKEDAAPKQIGLWLNLCSNLSAEVVAPSGFEWVLIDMEHSPNDLLSVLSQLQVFAASNAAALVRPSWNDPVLVKGILDLGAQGIIFPMVQNADQAKLAVASTRYPPNGIRGVAGSTRATAFGRVKDYLSEVENQTAVIIQLETKEALNNAKEIASVEGVDAVFFGPADIAADMGMLGQPLADQVWQEIMPVAQTLIELGIPIGTYVPNSEFSIKLLKQGFKFVACGADTTLLASAVDQLYAKVSIEANGDKK